MLSDKKIRGQYYTTSNPFVGSAFNLWNELRSNDIILEPFAGAGHIFDYFPNDSFDGYDIQPNSENIVCRDTLQDFPIGYNTCITNPPYLAKNSLKRRGGDVFFKYEDLYLDCLELMLQHCKYIAAIVPSTFYNTKLFRDRLLYWDKIDKVLFSDTDCPAGVAYFGPQRSHSKLYVNGQSVEEHTLVKGQSKLTFNCGYGQYVLTAIDSVKGRRISIAPVDDSFDRDKYLKPTSRNYVLFHSNIPLDCDVVNNKINQWRDDTKDFYLTSFKSMMCTGVYRKRISFSDLYYFIP